MEYLNNLDQSPSKVPTGDVRRRVIVANMLPLKVTRDLSHQLQWRFEWDDEAVVLQLKDGFPPGAKVVYVGNLPVEIDWDLRHDVAEYLRREFKCVPTFLQADLFNKFYHGFCKHFLWPVLHHMLPVTHSHGPRFDTPTWRAYVSANMIFADRVMQVVNPKKDYVWVHDYHLMILPTLLRRKVNRIRLGFFLHSPFPSFDIYRTLPVKEEILKGLLNCDLLGFHTFDYARNFMDSCGRVLGMKFQSKRGYLCLDCYGRTVCIKVLHVGIHMGQIEAVMSLPDTSGRIKELKRRYEGKVVLLGVDDTDIFKGISQKLMGMQVLLDKYPVYRGKVVLVQILNAPRSQGQDIQQVQKEISDISNEVNKRYGHLASGYQPIVCVNGPVSFQDKVAYYAISECVVVNATKDGMNLVPYTYTAVRQGCKELDKVLGDKDFKEPKRSVIVVSEFIGCSSSLSGAIHVNPWDISRVAEAMASAISMVDSNKALRHEKHYMYIKSHDVVYWARSFDEDIQRASSDHYRKIFWGLGFALNARVVVLGPNFRNLSADRIVPDYKKSERRLICLDYDGTMCPLKRVDKSPSAEVISLLNCLCSDGKNLVFIVSGRGRDSLSNWFYECQGLGLSAEHGYFTRWTKNSEWESAQLTLDSDWKEIALRVMEHYTEATDGSSIERKDCGLVWHYEDADPEFGTLQGKELLDHLQSVLANHPVTVNKGQDIVEVKLQGVSKGLVVRNLVAAMKSRGQPADFVLCIGDDKCDEDMFEAVTSAVSEGLLAETSALFTCTVGLKPSLAEYYVNDTDELVKMLRRLAAASAPQLHDAMPPHRSGETFKWSFSYEN